MPNITRGDSDLKNANNQPTGAHGNYYYHELPTPTWTDNAFTATGTATAAATDISGAFGAVTVIIGDVIWNTRTDEKIFCTSTDLSTVARGVDGSVAQAIAAGDYFRKVNYAVRVNGSVTPTQTNIPIDDGTGANSNFPDGNRPFGLVMRRANDQPEEILFCYAFDSVSLNDIDVKRNFMKNIASTNTTDLTIADNELLFVIGERMDDPRIEDDTTHTYNLDNWRQMATEGDIAVEAQGDKVELMTNEAGVTRILNKYEDFQVTGNVTSIRTLARMTLDTTVIDPDYDEGIGVDFDRSQEPKKFLFYAESLDERNKRGYFFIVQNANPWTDTYTEDQSTFPFTLRNVFDETFGGQKGVKFIGNMTG